MRPILRGSQELAPQDDVTQAARDNAAISVPVHLITEGLLGGGQDALAGLLGAKLGQRFGPVGKIHGVEHGRVLLVAEIAAQPE
jgi:hypothetical protein